MGKHGRANGRWAAIDVLCSSGTHILGGSAGDIDCSPTTEDRGQGRGGDDLGGCVDGDCGGWNRTVADLVVGTAADVVFGTAVGAVVAFCTAAGWKLVGLVGGQHGVENIL